MALPGWSLTQPTVAGDLTLFPKAFKWDSDTAGLYEETLVNVTNGGVKTGYLLHSYNVLPGIVFELTASEYATFETFMEATPAGVIDFWFVPDSDVMGTKYNVRREKCIPKAMAPVRESGSLVQRFSITLSLSVEVADEPLED